MGELKTSKTTREAGKTGTQNIKSPTRFSFLNNSKKSYKKRRKEILGDKINFTKFLVWFIESYPKSKIALKEKAISMENFM